MPQIDYMKVIGALAKTLSMETIDMKFHDRSTDRLDIIMGAAAAQEKKFTLSLTNFSAELAFSKQYLSEKDFEKWITAFEYELEQAFMKNVTIHRDEDASSHILKIGI
ncbi:MAG TPA: hypothetical protein PLM53_11040 [Spirochaetota bacterium]|nr:hypothetical protein [Spirochaetota bacterium]HPC41483.1 hypothetical protein [Spirochaetota bacterium]HPL15630.1 hypothetical protein [Spirochaetota bacterium]HQF09149.1 hypothetical protein [Spirochaetota bacterium]HQH97626.1 hypothetical protein [Spirochaetota bacterium]